VNFPPLVTKSALDIFIHKFAQVVSTILTNIAGKGFSEEKFFQRFGVSQVCLDVGQLAHHSLFFIIHHHGVCRSG